MTLAYIEFEDTGLVYRPKGRPLSGKPVVLVGGGPSLTLNLLDQVKAVGPEFILVNNSYTLFTEPQLVVALDKRWYIPQGFNHGTIGSQMGHVFVFPALHPSPVPDVPGAKIIKMARPPHGETENQILCEEREKLAGRNSGHAAVNLAYHLGASSIYLMGYDMGFVGGKSHWHGGHRVPSSQQNYEVRFRPAFDKLIEVLEHRGIPVRSLTPTQSKAPMATVEDLKKETEARAHEADSMDHPPTPAAI